MCVYSSRRTHTHTHTQYCTIRHLSLLLRALHFSFIKSPFFLVSGTWIFFYTLDFIRDGFHQGFFLSAADVKDFWCICATVCEPCLAHSWWRKSNWMISPRLPCQHLTIITIIISMTPSHALAPAWASGFAKMVSVMPKYIFKYSSFTSCAWCSQMVSLQKIYVVCFEHCA